MLPILPYKLYLPNALLRYKYKTVLGLCILIMRRKKKEQHSGGKQNTPHC